MNAQSRAVEENISGEAHFDFETIFHVHYERIARVIARVVRDPARAEELAVDIFWKLWRSPKAQSEKAGGWLYRSAVRIALDELRRHARRERYERLFGVAHRYANPEEEHELNEERRMVRRVLASIARRDAALLLLRADGLSYEEIAAVLELNPASIGTLLSRAQQAFRKEHERKYGPKKR